MVKEIMNLSPVQSRAIARHVPFQYISFLSYILSIQVFFYSSFERTKENVRATVQITTVIMGRLFYVMDSFLMAHGGAWSVSGCKFVTSKTLKRFWLFRLSDEICHRRLSIIRFCSCRQWFVPKSQESWQYLQSVHDTVQRLQLVWGGIFIRQRRFLEALCFN